MKHSIWLLIVLSECCLMAYGKPYILDIISRSISDDSEEETYVPAPEMIKRAGYKVESHVVVTEDGYILTLHRIPAARQNATAILLQHGLLSSSADWVVTGKDKGFAFILANQGYDVWLGNARGNTYSRKHKKYDESNPRFWKFSWHEMGIYDLPAVISYITNIKNDSIIYVGHSMGNTMFYVMASLRQDIASKVRAMFSLAPAVYLEHLKSPLKMLVPFKGVVQTFSDLFDLHEFLPRNFLFKLLTEYGCDNDLFDEVVCENVLFTISGFNKKQFNTTLLPTILAHTPAGASTMTVLHFVQGIDSGKFRQYDFGEQKNFKLYGQTYPPEYNLSKINVPITIFYADNDWLVSPLDVLKLYHKLPNKTGLHRVKYDTFTHFDFLWAIDAPTLVYKPLLPMIEKVRYK